MGDRVSKKQAAAMQAAYREVHPECWRLLQLNGVWRFCRRRPAICDHIPRKRDGWERPQVYYPLCDQPVGNCHAGWKHGGDPHEVDAEQAEGYRMLQQFAVKIMMGETNEDEVQEYMRGRTWWKKLDPVTDAMSIEGYLEQMADIFKNLQTSEMPRRRRWLLSRATDIRKAQINPG